MANEEHLKILRDGVAVWNKWRKENPKITPDLQKADLRGKDLSGYNFQETQFQNAVLEKNAELEKTNLTKANCKGAYFINAKLGEADLQEANLRGAHLNSADLLGTTLREANLQDADLRDATGLLSGQLAGTNLSGAKLDEDIRKFEGLANIEEASKNARKLFLVMLLGCAYSALTVFSTTDVQLLSGSASTSPLPIIQTEIPIAWFFGVAPGILLAIFLYFHLHLQHLWEGLADLPAIFPDGR